MAADAAQDGEALYGAITGLLRPLLGALDALVLIGRHLHPPRLTELVEAVGPRDAPVREAMAALGAVPWPDNLGLVRDYLEAAGQEVADAYQELRVAASDAEGLLPAYRALRHVGRAMERLYPLAVMLPPVSRYFLNPQGGDASDARARRLAEAARDSVESVGIMHADNERGSKGGFSIYVPEDYEPTRAWPVVFALHGGSGHGRDFLWTWARDARTRGVILVSPTSAGQTWSLMEPEIDGPQLGRMLDFVRQRWTVDEEHLLLTGMSDGGTFTFVSGLSAGSPFTHLAPIASSFHPMLLNFIDETRLRTLPIRLIHGAMDWMFPVDMARSAHQALVQAGADVTYCEIADLSHTYPREENAAILDWFMGPAAPAP
ncbi:hypothetical protein [Zavarzinia sp. CC-PAN008]|uniref:carboxylesterase family protein n=1 Tax=Zavarzinia sp. CC-PAN008 TaxID=3243332 RepID=UPI003F743AD8